jgi:hypothetical protein
MGTTVEGTACNKGIRARRVMKQIEPSAPLLSHTAQPRSAFGGTVTYPIAMPPLIRGSAPCFQGGAPL